MNQWSSSAVILRKVRLFCPFLLAAVYCLTPRPAVAHSGHVALAYPVEGITIDGDFSDWPEHLPRYSMEIVAFGAKPSAPDDLSASFRVAYNFEDQMLYFAFEMRDDALIVKEENDPEDYSTDRIDLSIYAGHNNDPKRLSYRASLLRKSVTYEWGRDTQGEDFQCAVVKTDNGWRQEWGIQRGIGSKRNPGFDPGEVLSIDCTVYDIDTLLSVSNLRNALDAGCSWLSWNRYFLYFPERPKPGDVILLPKNERIATLKGSIFLEDGKPTGNRRRVLITHAGNPEFKVHTRSDRTGRFKIDIPEGNYLVTLADGPRNRGKSIALSASKTSNHVRLTAPFNHGRSYASGPGKSVRVGRGKRSGLWQYWSVADGLPSPSILCGLEDSQGTFWFGTDGGGVVRFDGARFTVYTTEDGLASDQVCSIAEDESGRLWFGTGNRYKVGNGVSRYDGKAFVNFTEEDGLHSNTVLSIIQRRDGTMWFSGVHGMSTYDGREFLTYTPKDGVRLVWIAGLFEDHRGKLWILNTGPKHLRDDRLISAFDGKWDAMLTSMRMWNEIAEDSQGNLWFARGWFGTDASLLRFDGTGFHEFDGLEELGLHWIRSIAVAKDGTVWMGGLSRVVTYDGTEFRRIDLSGLPLPGIVHDIVLGGNGRVWLCTEQGIYLRQPTDFEKFTDRVPFYQDQSGNIWFQTLEHGSIISDRGEPFPIESRLPNHRIEHLADATEGGYWVVARDLHTELLHGFRFDGSNLKYVLAPEDFPKSEVKQLLGGSDDRLWIGYFLGLDCYEGGERRTYLNSNHQVERLYEDADGSLWVGTYRGLGHFVNHEFEFITQPKNPLSTRIYDLLRDRKGTFWVATPKGLVKSNGDTQRLLSTEQGLPSNAILSLYESGDGRLYIGTSGGGLCLYDGTVFQNISSKDGFHDRVSDVLEDQEGNIWVDASGRACRYEPNPEPPGVQILEVTSDRRHGPVRELTLTGRHERVSFEFEGVSFKTHPHNMAYVYRLAGLHSDWRPVYEGQTEYQNLPIGDYVFEVKAVDRNLTYSDTPASVRLSIQPAYGQLALVAGLAVATLGGLIASGLAVKHRRERNRSLLREKEAAESANRAKSLFLANMSHEIRTPMNAILGYAQILRFARDLPAQHRHYVETIQNSGDHLLGMINDILDLSKIEAERMELHPADFDLKGLIQTLETMFALQCREKGLEFKVEWAGPRVSILERCAAPPPMDTDSLVVRGDEAKLRQVLINLLGNAVKFTEQGGVTLRVKLIQNDEAAPPLRFLFEVIDSGPGIAPEEQARLFQAFQQADEGVKKGGTGLGLALAKRVAELMGGHLGVESRPGDGTRVWLDVTLPPGQGEIQSSNSEARQVAALSPDCHVSALVVDDVLQNREVLSQLLRNIGCEVRTAASGEEALGLLQQELPDIVFMDVRMPGIDGIETTQEILRRYGSGRMKFVAVSASVMSHQQEEFMKEGFDAFLGKPFRFQALCDCLSNLLGVELQYAEQDAIKDPLEALDPQHVIMPPDLLERLRDAAHRFNVTKLEQGLREWEAANHSPHPETAYVRRLAQEGKFDEVTEFLDRIESGTK